MKNLVMMTAAALLVLAAQAHAQTTRTGEYAPLYYALKGGFMQPDGKNNDSALNIGGMLGQPFHRNVAWEAELTLTLSDGEVGNNRDWDITTLAGYAVFRGPQGEKLSLKGKVGISYWDSSNDEDFSLSTGIGLGIRAGKSGIVDLEFTEIDDQVDFISVGYIFNYR